MYKAFSSEGGTRVAAFATFPGHIKDGVVNDSLVSVKDIAPTLLDFAGVKRHQGKYRGRAIEPMSGWSLRSLMQTGEGAPAFDERELGMEFVGRYAYRRGRWKMTAMPAPYGSGEAELYNLATDPGETANLAKEQPALLAELSAKWQHYAEKNGVILPDWVSGY